MLLRIPFIYSYLKYVLSLIKGLFGCKVKQEHFQYLPQTLRDLEVTDASCTDKGLMVWNSLALVLFLFYFILHVSLK